MQDHRNKRSKTGGRRDGPRGREARHGAAAQGGAVIYGWHSALAALRNPQRTIRRVAVTPAALARLSESDLAPRLAALPVEDADPRDLDRLAGGTGNDPAVHQGIVVVAEPLPEPGEEVLAEASLVVVLDQVTDPHNVGAILRSAAAFGAGALMLTERHGPAETGVLAKAASGGLEHVPILRVTNLARALDDLAGLGFWRIGLDSAGETPLEKVTPARIALVLGAEGKGLRRLTRERCDVLARLDMPGAIASLNVSNAAALAMYVVRALQKTAP